MVLMCCLECGLDFVSFVGFAGCFCLKINIALD